MTKKKTKLKHIKRYVPGKKLKIKKRKITKQRTKKKMAPKKIKKKAVPERKRVRPKKRVKKRKVIKKKKAILKKRKAKKRKVRRKAKRKKKVSRRTKVFSSEKFQAFFDKGKQRGFVTTSEILYFFPNIEKDVLVLEDLYEVLEKEGIEIKETKERLEIEEKPKKAKRGKRVGETRIDPIQLYLKEIGKVSFLTAEGEKELARKIEKGEKEAMNKLMKANLRLVVSIAKRYIGRSQNLGILSHRNLNNRLQETYKSKMNRLILRRVLSLRPPSDPLRLS